MTGDLPRIGPEPDCDYPGCLLLGRVLIPAPGRPAARTIVCLIHLTWDGHDPDPKPPPAA